jgi:hypothetical protein
MARSIFEINNIKLGQYNNTILYEYTFSEAIRKYFNRNTPFYVRYENIDLSHVPKHLLVIPLLAQLLPISWFAGFDIKCKSVDSRFYDSSQDIKSQLHSQYGFSQAYGGNLIVNTLEKSEITSGSKTLLLYSGGVDSITSFINHRQADPDIATIFGADISLNNRDQWDRLRHAILDSELVSAAKKFFIESNLRNFYSHHVPSLVPNRDWWGRVQHGLGLTGLLAPLSYLYNHANILIASTYSSDMRLNWGSTPTVDNLVKWGSTTVTHDAYEQKRIDKIKTISDTASRLGQPIILRVCYASKNTGVNCSHCEKCYRTILALMLNNANPNDFGFVVTSKIYDDVTAFLKRGFYSEGEAYFWKELAGTIQESDKFYYFRHQEEEYRKMKALESVLIDEYRKGLRKVPALTGFRRKIQVMFPILTQKLIQLRNNVMHLFNRY